MAIRINGVDYNTIRDKKEYSTHGEKTSVNSSIGDGTQHGTYHLAGNPNLYEVQRNNNFEFVVDFGDSDLLEAGLTIDGGSTEAFKPSYAQEVLRMSVSSAFVPHFSQEVVQVKRGNSTLKYAGTPTFQDGSITLVDYIGADTKAILMAWQNLSYNVKTEKVGLASDYKKNAHLIEYSPDYQKVREWILYGCWVSALSEDGFSSDSGDKHNVTATISFDKAALDTTL